MSGCSHLERPAYFVIKFRLMKGDRMKAAGLILSFAICVGPIFGQQRLLIDTSSPEGKVLAQIEHESDVSRKQAMLEDFMKTYPSSSQAGWAYDQLQSIYLQAQQYDKVLELGDKALTSDPNNLQAAYNNLKAAEAKNDLDGIIKWSDATSKAASHAIASPNTSDPNSQSAVDYAKQIKTYSEYSIYAETLKVTEPAKIVSLVESLQARSPDSPYLSKSYGRYLNALRQMGQNDKAATAAEAQIQRDPNNEEALLIAADYNMQHNERAKALSYSTKLTEVLKSKAKPEELSDADWQKKKDMMLGVGYWMQGVAYSEDKKFSDADKALREALPLVKDNSQLLAMALFHLGLSDYQIGKATKNKAMLQDGLKFSQQSAAIKSPVQAQAQNNVKAISKEVVVRRPAAK
jgi:tetratricopeptide (TPR) repeat protein